MSSFRSSRPEVFCKKGVLRNFAKSTGKHLCQSLFFNKVAGLRPETLLKKRLWHRCFPVNFAEFLRTPFIIKHVWWLLLHFAIYSHFFPNPRELPTSNVSADKSDFHVLIKSKVSNKYTQRHLFQQANIL